MRARSARANSSLRRRTDNSEVKDRLHNTEIYNAYLEDQLKHFELKFQKYKKKYQLVSRHSEAESTLNFYVKSLEKELLETRHQLRALKKTQLITEKTELIIMNEQLVSEVARLSQLVLMSTKPNEAQTTMRKQLTKTLIQNEKLKLRVLQLSEIELKYRQFSTRAESSSQKQAALLKKIKALQQQNALLKQAVQFNKTNSTLELTNPRQKRLRIAVPSQRAKSTARVHTEMSHSNHNSRKEEEQKQKQKPSNEQQLVQLIRGRSKMFLDELQSSKQYAMFEPRPLERMRIRTKLQMLDFEEKTPVYYPKVEQFMVKHLAELARVRALLKGHNFQSGFSCFWAAEIISVSEASNLLRAEPFLLSQQAALLMARYLVEDNKLQKVVVNLGLTQSTSIVKSIWRNLVGQFQAVARQDLDQFVKRTIQFCKFYKDLFQEQLGKGMKAFIREPERECERMEISPELAQWVKNLAIYGGRESGASLVGLRMAIQELSSER